MVSVLCYFYIYDSSCCTWLFLMKTRTELFSIFLKFHAKVRTQFNTSIHMLHNDNAKEYLFGPFSSFLSSLEILHQSFCAYTPQQNGVAECKNRHLVETVRTLLLHDKVPQRFWGDATFAACYLINHMLSSVLHDKIPHSILFPKQPLFCLLPRVFGCVCFVYILTPGQDKLSAKAMKCIFLGYCRFNEVMVATFLVHINTLFLPMSHFLRTLLCSLSTTLLDVISLPFLYPVLDTSPVPPTTPPQPLQVYTHCSRIDIGPSADSSPLVPSSTMSVLPSLVDILIAIWKGTRSSHYPHLIYNFLTYLRLSSSYFAVVSTLFSVYVPQTMHEALSLPDWKHVMVEEMAPLHSSGT